MRQLLRARRRSGRGDGDRRSAVCGMIGSHSRKKMSILKRVSVPMVQSDEDTVFKSGKVLTGLSERVSE